MVAYRQVESVEADRLLPDDLPLDCLPLLPVLDPPLLPLQHPIPSTLPGKLVPPSINLHPDSGLLDPDLPQRPGLPLIASHRADQAGPFLPVE